MKKQTIQRFGEHYLLGIDKEGVKHYMDKATWDCGWYWGFGYIHTFTNNRAPEMSRDINGHYHADSFKGYPHPDHLVETPFTKEEWWTIRELISTLYILKKTAELCHTGGAHITTNPLKELLKNEEEENRINKVLIPKLLGELYKILKGE